ncbi:hypothetical protein DMP17_35745 [Pseudonocardia sp. TMWB2A]
MTPSGTGNLQSDRTPSGAAERPGSTTPQQPPAARGSGCSSRVRWRNPCARSPSRCVPRTIPGTAATST